MYMPTVSSESITRKVESMYRKLSYSTNSKNFTVVVVTNSSSPRICLDSYCFVSVVTIQIR